MPSTGHAAINLILKKKVIFKLHVDLFSQMIVNHKNSFQNKQTKK